MTSSLAARWAHAVLSCRDDTELWVADVAPDGSLTGHRKVGWLGPARDARAAGGKPTVGLRASPMPLLWASSSASARCVTSVQVAGGPGESVVLPQWGPSGDLFFVTGALYHAV